jgi:vanillate O-demethylase monooxygenase subunit
MTQHDRVLAGSPIADHHTPLIRNAWYVAGLSDEIGRELLSRTLLETRVVLYRKLDGTVVALRDRCPHRSFPLSKSQLKGDRLTCRYHGLSFDEHGKCVHVPSSPEAKSNIRVRSFTVVERKPLVWIWMGEADLADPTLIPDLHWLDDANWTTVQGSYAIGSNYVAMHENLLDQTHFTFLHEGTVGTPEWAAAPLEVSTQDDVVSLRRELLKSEPPGIYAAPMRLQGKLVDRLSEAAFIGPAGHVAKARITQRDGSTEEGREFRVNITHLFTPQTQHSIHYWWFNSRDFYLQDDAASQFLHDASAQAYYEDVEALQWISDTVVNDAMPHREFSVRADRPGLLMRQALARMAAREQKPSP